MSFDLAGAEDDGRLLTVKDTINFSKKGKRHINIKKCQRSQKNKKNAEAVWKEGPEKFPPSVPAIYIRTVNVGCGRSAGEEGPEKLTVQGIYIYNCTPNQGTFQHTLSIWFKKQHAAFGRFGSISRYCT